MSKISIKNLDLYYGDFKALKNINLEIEENKSRERQRQLSEVPAAENQRC
jgi:hypothetical protein